MDISIVIEKVEGNGYRATSFVPTHVMAEGRTREEALDQLCKQIRGCLSRAEVVQLHVPLRGESHPWKAIAGSWRHHPDKPQLERNMQEYRRQVDADPDRL
jgi:predicted RNase H-like HicB family nuclease